MSDRGRHFYPLASYSLLPFKVIFPSWFLFFCIIYKLKFHRIVTLEHKESSFFLLILLMSFIVTIKWTNRKEEPSWWQNQTKVSKLMYLLISLLDELTFIGLFYFKRRQMDSIYQEWKFLYDFNLRKMWRKVVKWCVRTEKTPLKFLHMFILKWDSDYYK